MEDTGRSETSADAMTNNNGHTYLDRSTGRELDQRTNHDPGARLAQAYPLLPPHRYGETSCLSARRRSCLVRDLIPATNRGIMGFEQMSPVQLVAKCAAITRSPRTGERPLSNGASGSTSSPRTGRAHHERMVRSHPVRPDNVYAITPLRFSLTIQLPS